MAAAAVVTRSPLRRLGEKIHGGVQDVPVARRGHEEERQELRTAGPWQRVTPRRAESVETREIDGVVQAARDVYKQV